MAWTKAGTTTLTGTADIIDIDPVTDNKFITVLHHGLYSGDSNGTFNFNNDSSGTNGSSGNYAQRNNYAGGSEGVNVSQTKFSYNDSSTHDSIFSVSYVSNFDTEEKLFVTHHGTVTSTGAGTAPYRTEQVGKWSNTNDEIDSIKHTQSSGGGDYLTDSNVSVIGSDGVESLNVQDGAVYYDKQLNKEYVLNNNIWTEV